MKRISDITFDSQEENGLDSLGSNNEAILKSIGALPMGGNC